MQGCRSNFYRGPPPCPPGGGGGGSCGSARLQNGPRKPNARHRQSCIAQTGSCLYEGYHARNWVDWMSLLASACVCGEVQVELLHTPDSLSTLSRHDPPIAPSLPAAHKTVQECLALIKEAVLKPPSSGPGVGNEGITGSQLQATLGFDGPFLLYLH